ncbi:MAG: DUF1254 domain-containing protein [Ottowia sp.]|uniref:DUF1254 domain-containing protein n=1 Tax=Ottowia sp. TaxID=1898956 RepID=UPI0039E32DE7
MTASPTLTEDEAYEVGVEAYTYAYPLVLMEMTNRVTTNVARPDSASLRAPYNQLVHATAFPDADFKDVVRANADTLYSMVRYDVSQEPLIVTVPDAGGRYFSLTLMDMWTDAYASVGTRTTGTATGHFAIAVPGWRGALPAGVRRIDSPTPHGWLTGRIQTNGAADYATVHRLQSGMQAVPLSVFGQAWTPPAGRVDPSIDMATPPVEQVKQLGPGAYFALAAELLGKHPPHAADYAVLLRMERLGLVPGQRFDLARADAAVQRALERAAPDAFQSFVGRGRSRYVPRNGWNMAVARIGSYGEDYLLRAFIAFAGLGALPPEEAIYPSGFMDVEGRPLDGAAHRYVLHFGKDEIPPAKAFWSLSMYGADQFFAANPIGRYAIGDRDPLRYNADGSLDLYIQHESPGQDKEANWLPAPAGPFSMNLRLYLPRPEVTDGRWLPPGLARLPLS